MRLEGFGANFRSRNKFYKAGIKDPVIKRKKSIPSIHLNPKGISPAGNRTPVSRVTGGGDTHHYTTEELDALKLSLMVYKWRNAPSHFNVK